MDRHKCCFSFDKSRSSEDQFLVATIPAQILSPALTRVSLGGTLNLECIIGKPPGSIWWWLNGTKLDLNEHRGGVYIETMKHKNSSSSKLRIADFKHDDGGHYECRSSGIDHKQVIKAAVHVIVIEETKVSFFYDDEEMASKTTSKKLLHQKCLHLLIVFNTITYMLLIL